jgi:hypothetical protein
MIRIYNGISSKRLVVATFTELAEEHFMRVTESKGKYVSPLTDLVNARKILGVTAKPLSSGDDLKLKFLQKVSTLFEFRRLLTAPLSEFPSIIGDYTEFMPIFESGGYKEIVNLFGYSRLRKLRLMYTFAQDLGVKTCPYCNNHYTLTIKKSKKANLHFDHFYAKSKYPYLTLNFFNLVPCCGVCNTGKSDTLYPLIIHPFVDALSNKFKFATDSKSIIDLILKGDKELKNILISLEAEPGYQSVIDQHTKAFNLQEVYSEHKDIVFEIYSKQYIYSDSFMKVLRTGFGKHFSKSEIDRFVLGNYTLESEINKRPLSKFMQDIQNEAIKARRK